MRDNMHSGRWTPSLLRQQMQHFSNVAMWQCNVAFQQCSYVAQWKRNTLSAKSEIVKSSNERQYAQWKMDTLSAQVKLATKLGQKIMGKKE